MPQIVSKSEKVMNHFKAGFSWSYLLLKVIVEVEVWGFNTNIVLPRQTKNSFNGRANRGSGCNCNGTLNSLSSLNRSSLSRWLRGRGRQGRWNSLLDEWGQLCNDVSNQIRVWWRADSWDSWLLGDDGRLGRGDETRWWRLLVDGDKSFADVSCFKVAISSSCVGHSDEGSKGINIARKQIKLSLMEQQIVCFVIYQMCWNVLTWKLSTTN